MIQRVQTVYLSLGALFLAAFLVTPAARQFEMGALGTAGLYFSGLLAAGAAAASIFLFARRQLQRKVIVIGQLGTVALLAILVGGLYAGGALRTQEGIDGILLFGVAPPGSGLHCTLPGSTGRRPRYQARRFRKPAALGGPKVRWRKAGKGFAARADSGQ